MRTFLCLVILVVPLTSMLGQNLSGSLESRANFFIRDTTIGAALTPQYDRQLYGAENWVDLTYSNWGFDFALRYDLFNNSNLRDPSGSLTQTGIGYWQIRRKIHKLDVTAGYIYDQIGTGIIYRAYEDRSQLIDNALYGARLMYKISDHWQIKGFTGLQKRLFEEYNSVVKGAAIDGYVLLSEGFSLAPGIGVVNRTFDDQTMNGIIANVETYDDEEVFIPEYNTYAVALHNRLTAGGFSWYAEVGLKTDDVQLDPNSNLLIGDEGQVYYSSLSYSRRGLAVTLEGKRTEAFDFRVRPQEALNRGQIHFIPPMARENTYRLTTRYQPATQFIGEKAFQADVKFSPIKKLNFEVNYSYIDDLEDVLLYRELYTQATYKYKRSWAWTLGLQMQKYNQDRFEVKPGVPTVETIIPFTEFSYKFSRRNALKLEFQYMDTDEDLGKWVYGLAEYTMAPHWSFEISDMWNLGRDTDVPITGLNKHYPTAGVVYANKANRYSLRYVKQVEGIVCSGGICRLEPAFSGFRFSVNSTF